MAPKPTVFVQAGQRFGRLTVIDPEVRKELPSGKTGRAAICRCDCGNMVTPVVGSLVTGNTKSCGCFHSDRAREAMTEMCRSPEQRQRVGDRSRTHGLSDHPLYPTYLSMMHRCYEPQATNYQWYGGRGITVCDEWRGDPAAFITWIEANLGPRPAGMTLDRIDNDGPYAPGKVRWATQSEQVRNQRPRSR